MLNRLPMIWLSVVSSWPWTSLATISNLTIPSAWQGTESNMSRSLREELANSAAAALLSLANPNGDSPDLLWVSDHASAFAVLALQDYYSGNSSWTDVVTNGMEAYYKQSGLYGGPPRLNSDSIYWGLVFFYAYRTYKQDILLESAITAYNTTYMGGFINASAASSGAGAGRNISLTSSPGCTDKTVAGGVFYQLDIHNDTEVNSETVSPFMALSAYLYEQTGESVYAQATQMSLDFVVNHLWNGTIVLDAFDTRTCAGNNSPVLLTSDQAWFIEGLSVWANVTNNDTLTSLLSAAVSSATVFPVWSLQNGVVVEATGPNDDHATLKGIFIRALTEARTRNPGTDLARYIETYVTVQFNSILNSARSSAPNNSFYSMSWFGPPTQTFSARGNIAALDVLNAAFSLVTPTTSSAGNLTSPPASTTSSPITHKNSKSSEHSKAGTIGGSVAGAGVVILAAMLILFRRRSRTKDENLASDKSDDVNSRGTAVFVEPFELASPDTGRPSKWQRFYAPQQDQDALPSSRLAPLGGSDDMHIEDAGQTHIVAPVEGMVEGQDTISEQDNQIIAELPTLVERLNGLLQRRGGEPPPEYEN